MKRRQSNMSSIEKTKEWSADELTTLKDLIHQYALTGKVVPTQVLLEALPKKSTHAVVAKHRAEKIRMSICGESKLMIFFKFFLKFYFSAQSTFSSNFSINNLSNSNIHSHQSIHFTIK
jgi:hypothetical protein